MPLKRHISNVSLLFTSLSCMIGSGWLFGAYYTAQIAGPASILSWFIGGILVALLALCFSELGTMMPVAGGIARYTHITHGSSVSFVMSWLAWLSCVSVAPTEVQAILQYATHFFPWLTHGVDNVIVLTAKGYIIAAIMLFLLSWLNLLGVKYLAKCNNAITLWKLIIPLFTAIALLFKRFDYQHIVEIGNWFPYGWHGVFASLPASVIFSYLGFREATSLAGETKNPKVAIPLAVVGSVIICTLIYAFIQLAFIGMVDGSMLKHGWQGLSFSGDSGPFAALAILAGMHWLAIVIYADAMISPSGTGLIYTATTARINYAMAENGHVPKWMGLLNRSSVPGYAVLFNTLVGLILFFPFPGWQALIKFQSIAIVIAYSVGPLSLYALRSQAPNHPRPFKLPCVSLFSWLNFFICTLLIYWAGWFVLEKILFGLLFGIVIWLVMMKMSGKQWREEIDFKHLRWLIWYLMGLALISYNGHYDGRGIWPEYFNYLQLFMLSIVIFHLSNVQKLPASMAQNALESA